MIVTTKEGWRLEIKLFEDPVRRAYICTGPTNVEGFTGCKVNGVTYYVSAHLNMADEKFSHGGLYMSRASHMVGRSDDWTWPARRKLEARLIEIARTFAADHDEEFHEARREYRAGQIQKREEKIAELTEQINKLRDELGQLLAGAMVEEAVS